MSQPGTLESQTPQKEMETVKLNNMNINVYDNGSQSEEESNGNTYGLSHTDNRIFMFKHKTLTGIVLASMVLSIFAFAMASFSISQYKLASDELKLARENRGKVCLPCEDQAIQIDAWKEKNKVGECCVKLEEVLSMMNKIAEDQAQKYFKQAEDLSRLKYSSVEQNGGSNGSLARRVSAHLVLAQNSDTAQARIPWSSYGAGHIEDGLSLENGHIKVKQTGYYFIYCQLGFFWSFPSSAAPDPAISITLTSSKDGAESTLASNKQMVWRSNSERKYSQQVGSLSGVFRLTAGTELAIRSDYQNLLIKNPEDSFFGLFKL